MKKDVGKDKYENLVLVCEPVHKLIHATTEETIDKYRRILNFNATQLKKLNKYRTAIGLQEII